MITNNAFKLYNVTSPEVNDMVIYIQSNSFIFIHTVFTSLIDCQIVFKHSCIKYHLVSIVYL